MILRLDSYHSLGWKNVEKLSLKTQNTGDPLLVQWLGLSTFSAKGPDWSLIRELRSHKLHDAAKRKHHRNIDAWKRSERTSNWMKSILGNRWMELEAGGNWSHDLEGILFFIPQRKKKKNQNLQGKTNISNCTRRTCFKYEATSVFSRCGECEKGIRNTGIRGSRLCNHRKSNHSFNIPIQWTVFK